MSDDPFENLHNAALNLRDTIIAVVTQQSPFKFWQVCLIVYVAVVLGFLLGKL